MSYEVLLLGLLVGAANYCFRYLPLRLRVGNARPTKRGAVGFLASAPLASPRYALCWLSLPPTRSDARYTPFRAHAGRLRGTGCQFLIKHAALSSQHCLVRWPMDSPGK